MCFFVVVFCYFGARSFFATRGGKLLSHVIMTSYDKRTELACQGSLQACVETVPPQAPKGPKTQKLEKRCFSQPCVLPRPTAGRSDIYIYIYIMYGCVCICVVYVLCMCCYVWPMHLNLLYVYYVCCGCVSNLL